jgi:hypothetical protein
MDDLRRRYATLAPPYSTTGAFKVSANLGVALTEKI